MGRVNYIYRMGRDWKVSFMMIKLMGMGYYIEVMEAQLKVNGDKIN
jgi:hypothetical protein